MPPEPERSCYEKARYATEEIAQGVAAACYERRGHWLRVYACEECGGFHLTHLGALPRERNWRPPAKSARQLAWERDQRDRRRGRRR